MNKNEMLEVGYVNNVRGLHGEIKVIHYCDEKEVFKEIPSVVIEEKVYDIKYVKFVKEQVILKLSGIESIDEAKKLQNKTVFAKRNDLPELLEGSFYIADIIGFSVITEASEKIGVLKDVDVSGPTDIFVVKRENKKDTYIPHIKKFVKSIDTSKGEIIITPIEGLIDWGSARWE